MRKAAAFLAVLLAGLLVWQQQSSRAGAPLPRPECQGTEHRSCHQGRVEVSCCPEGAKCNYAYAPFQECGYDTCVPGNDPGLCPPRTAITQQATDEADCKAKYGSWEPACIGNVVTPACIMPVPTNYTGPDRNPPFRECGDRHCTTSQYIEDCFPRRAEGVSCLTGWTKVCLEGRISERCLGLGGDRSAASTGFVACGTEGRCAIGDASACPR